MKIPKNKYDLTISKIKKLQVGDRSKINQKNGFWRNDAISAWCISKSVGNSEFCDENSFWIGFYDVDAKAYAGKFRISLDSHGGMCSYVFNKFFQKKDIAGKDDFEIQKIFLEEVTKLIDKGILVPAD